MDQSLKVAVAGLGTVGAGTLKLLWEHKELLKDRCGRELEVTAVSSRDRNRDRGVSLDGIKWFDDPVAMAREADADVIVELIGGSDGVAKDVCEQAIASQRSVVTANKALIALHGVELASQAEGIGVTLAFEAAVAGGIPIIKAVREGLAANRLSRVYGILNGTCNFILTKMRMEGRSFDEVLAEAQKLGYAEADPSVDVDGIDAAHKLAILSSVSFGCKVNFEAVHIEGIRHVSSLDIRFAEELGYRIKLLGIAQVTKHGLEQRVHPCMVPLEDPIAHIEDVFNAVVVDGDHVDTTMYEGRGAGAGPTASAVVSDLVDIARGRTIPAFALPVSKLVNMPPSPMELHKGAYYVRLMVHDRAGVFADVAAILRDHTVSMESILQRGHADRPGGAVPVVMTLHETEEGKMMRTLAEIEKLDAMVEPPRMIRIESLNSRP